MRSAERNTLVHSEIVTHNLVISQLGRHLLDRGVHQRGHHSVKQLWDQVSLEVKVLAVFFAQTSSFAPFQLAVKFGVVEAVRTVCSWFYLIRTDNFWCLRGVLLASGCLGVE